MSKTERSPGSWAVREREWDGANWIRAIVTDTGEYVAEAHEDDAPFIASAPDLLEQRDALLEAAERLCRTTLMDGQERMDAWDGLKAAIAKARGE